jgi:streptogramin lyase
MRSALGRAVAGLAVAAPFVMGTVSASSLSGHSVFTFRDPAIVESSALVVRGGLFYTLNDSGDSGRVFAVDDTGRTVGVTHWAQLPHDCEAMAPAGPGEVWVGDIGDNLADRSSIVVARMPVGRGDRTVQVPEYELTYPDRPANAETLVSDPLTGRLYVATKDVFGGMLYAAPRVLSADHPNPLTPVGHVLSVATDGSFFPDGRHLLVRNYGTAAVYAWPSMRKIDTFTLPPQGQGEGISVALDGTVYASSEGLHSPVIEVPLPAKVRRAVGTPTSSSSSPSAQPSGTTSSGDSGSVASDSTDSAARDLWPWLAGGLLGIGLIVLLLRSLRPR